MSLYNLAQKSKFLLPRKIGRIEKWITKKLRLLELIGNLIPMRGVMNEENNLKKVKMIFIETITACNLRCSYCPNSIYDRGLLENMKKMEAELFYKIIDELSEIGWCGEIQPHAYGEPLLDDRILQLIEYAKENLPRSRINLFTNGELLELDLYKKLIKAGVDQFSITQHLPKKPNGILKVLDYRKKYGDDNVELSYRKLNNINNRGGLIKIDKERGNSIQPSQNIGFAYGLNILIRCRDYLSTIAWLIYKKLYILSNGRRLVKIDKEKKHKNCFWPSRNIGITYDGNILVCCHDYLNTIKVGNIKNEKLVDIWKKLNYIRLRKEIMNGVSNYDLCKQCRDL